MLNQLICHECLSVVFPSRDGTLPAARSPRLPGTPGVPVRGPLGLEPGPLAVSRGGCPGGAVPRAAGAARLQPRSVQRSDSRGENGDFVVSWARLGIGVWF